MRRQASPHTHSLTHAHTHTLPLSPSLVVCVCDIGSVTESPAGKHHTASMQMQTAPAISSEGGAAVDTPSYIGVGDGCDAWSILEPGDLGPALQQIHALCSSLPSKAGACMCACARACVSAIGSHAVLTNTLPHAGALESLVGNILHAARLYGVADAVECLQKILQTALEQQGGGTRTRNAAKGKDVIAKLLASIPASHQ